MHTRAPRMCFVVSGPVSDCQAGLRHFRGVFHQALDVARRRVSDGLTLRTHGDRLRACGMMCKPVQKLSRRRIIALGYD